MPEAVAVGASSGDLEELRDPPLFQAALLLLAVYLTFLDRYRVGSPKMS